MNTLTEDLSQANNEINNLKPHTVQLNDDPKTLKRKSQNWWIEKSYS